MDDRAARRPEEIADVVDEHDRVVGRAPRALVRARKLLHRGVAVLCRNGSGKLYVHRRTETKDIFPGMYDMFIAGMVVAGETYVDAARRELAEELGIMGVEPRLLFQHLYLGADNPGWCGVFEVHWDGDITPDSEEIASGEFLTDAELDAALEERPFVPDGKEVYLRYRAWARGRATPEGRPHDI